MRKMEFDTPEDRVAYKKAWMKAYRQRNKAKLSHQNKLKQRSTRAANKAKAIEYLGGSCSRCGLVTEHTCVYDFHHTDTVGKEADPGALMHYAWSRIQKELDKCVLLCANCHRIEHEKDLTNE